MALLPPGAMCLGLALQTNLAVDLGLDDDKVAWLGLATTGLGALGCVVGGLISDRVDRRKSLNVYISLMSLPVLVMMGVLMHYGWLMPLAEGAAHPTAAPMLIFTFWACTIAYAFFQGLMYSTTMAIYMDVTNPLVAGTQFTAYMAMSNLTISYSATWQGIAIEAWGYPGTMLVDAIFGLVFLAVLRFTRRRPGDPSGYSDAHADSRARSLARALALLCLAWLPVHAMQSQFGTAVAIVNTVFSLVFIASMLFLLAGGTVLASGQPQLARQASRFAPLMLLLLIRNSMDSIAGFFSAFVAAERVQQVAEVAFYGLPLVAAGLLWRLSQQAWESLRVAPDSSEALAS
jgi:PAT family beta-lactamase induction signal transducer AmpG